MARIIAQNAAAAAKPVKYARQPVHGATETDGPSTSRGRRKRAVLIRAAREVFEAVGFSDARIAQIAERAGTSYGSFYFYFDSKEAIFREVVSEFTRQMFEVSHARVPTATDPIERIEAANRAYLAAYRQNARLLAVLEEVSPYDQEFRDLTLEIRNLFVHRNEQGIRRLQELGLADPQLDAHIAASALGGMV
jgi:AcrR family transcriptional regulator